MQVENKKQKFRDIAGQIFLAGVAGVSPDKLIAAVVSVTANCLKIADLVFPLNVIEHIYVIGAGKAVALMGAEIEKILAGRLTKGYLVVRYGYGSRLNHITVAEAGHPVPDENGIRATDEIMRIAENAGRNDLVICLLSGGGSSLLTDIPEDCTFGDLKKVNDILINSGASISEINAVRKHLSYIKGGQLARAVYPASLVNIILSDVPGNPLDVIASGPTVPDTTTFQQALNVLENFRLTDLIPQTILNFLTEGNMGKRPETPKEDDHVFERTYNVLAGTNRTALEAAKIKALEYNINSVIIDDQLQGDASSVAEYLVELSLKFKNNKEEIKPVCLLFGGETTVRMTGKGEGGRNQHLALLCSVLLKDHPGITILSAGTDGSDGNTEAAGAVVDSDTMHTALEKNVDPDKHLTGFDSFHFFKKTGGHIITGPTQTNVMDLIVIIVE